MGRQVAVLRDGALAQVAAPEKLYRQPADADLAQFVGEAVLLPGLAAGGFATCALGRLELALPVPDGPVEVMVRPEQIRLEPRTNVGSVQGASSRRNLLRTRRQRHCVAGRRSQASHDSRRRPHGAASRAPTSRSASKAA